MKNKDALGGKAYSTCSEGPAQKVKLPAPPFMSYPLPGSLLKNWKTYGTLPRCPFRSEFLTYTIQKR